MRWAIILAVVCLVGSAEASGDDPFRVTIELPAEVVCFEPMMLVVQVQNTSDDVAGLDVDGLSSERGSVHIERPDGTRHVVVLPDSTLTCHGPYIRDVTAGETLAFRRGFGFDWGGRRPIFDRPGEYCVYVDFDGHVSEPVSIVVKALPACEREAVYSILRLEKAWGLYSFDTGGGDRLLASCEAVARMDGSRIFAAHACISAAEIHRRRAAYAINGSSRYDFDEECAAAERLISRARKLGPCARSDLLDGMSTYLDGLQARQRQKMKAQGGWWWSQARPPPARRSFGKRHCVLGSRSNR